MSNTITKWWSPKDGLKGIWDWRGLTEEGDWQTEERSGLSGRAGVRGSRWFLLHPRWSSVIDVSSNSWHQLASATSPLAKQWGKGPLSPRLKGPTTPLWSKGKMNSRVEFLIRLSFSASCWMSHQEKMNGVKALQSILQLNRIIQQPALSLALCICLSLSVFVCMSVCLCPLISLPTLEPVPICLWVSVCFSISPLGPISLSLSICLLPIPILIPALTI